MKNLLLEIKFFKYKKKIKINKKMKLIVHKKLKILIMKNMECLRIRDQKYK